MVNLAGACLDGGGCPRPLVYLFKWSFWEYGPVGCSGNVPNHCKFGELEVFEAKKCYIENIVGVKMFIFAEHYEKREITHIGVSLS